MRLSEHPFYVMWKEGKLSATDISNYAHAYLQLIEHIPLLWKRALEGLNVNDETGYEIVNEEFEHINLWKEWMDELPAPTKHISMDDVVEKLYSMNPAQLLGAIHSFEVQQPEVAKVKRDCLVKFYGFEEDKLKYFDEHANNEYKHINYALNVAKSKGIDEEFSKGFKMGLEIFYKSLDRFMS